MEPLAPLDPPGGDRSAAIGHVDETARWRRAAVVTGGVLLAVVMGQHRSYTWESVAGVLLASAAVLWVGLVRPPRRLPAPRRVHWVGIAAWSVPVLGFSALEIVNDVLGSTYAHPTLSVLLDPVLDNPVNRTVSVAAWLLAGWELVRR